MTMTSAAVRTRSRRDSEADVETEIYVRPEGQPMAWDRVMVLQIMNDLESRLPRVVPPPRPGPSARVAPSSRVVPSSRAASPRVIITKRRTSRVTPTPPLDEPNVFLTPWTPADPLPPWSELLPTAPDQLALVPGATTASGSAVDEPLVLDERPREVRKARGTRIPWLVFVMAFGIAFGIGQDRQLRRELGSNLRGATVHAAAVVAHRVSSAF
jgi:hypothetical protein